MKYHAVFIRPVVADNHYRAYAVLQMILIIFRWSEINHPDIASLNFHQIHFLPVL